MSETVVEAPESEPGVVEDEDELSESDLDEVLGGIAVSWLVEEE